MVDIEYFKRKMQLIELRYNPYHDPSNGRFTSGGGGGGGFLYSPNKKKGEKGMNGDGSSFYVAPDTMDKGEQALANGEYEKWQKGKNSQKPTNAKIIDNMNEAQIDIEIAKTKKTIAEAEKVMGVSDMTNSAGAKAMQEAFPLGYGARTPKQVQQLAKQNNRDLAKAQKYVDAYKRKEAAEIYLGNLEAAKNLIKGSGKTPREITAEALKKQAESSDLKWKTTQKGFYNGSGYSPKIIAAGDFEIHGSSGYYTLYRNGKQVASSSKLSDVKAFAGKMLMREEPK